MNKKKVIISILLLICIIIFSSKFIINIIEDNDSNKVFVIGMSQANLYEPWRISMYNEIKEAAKKYDNIKVIYKDAGGDTDKQKKDIEDLIDFGADLLIVSINDSEKLESVVKKAYESVPVIMLDRAVEGYDYTLYIGSDNEAIGRKAGELVVEACKGKKTNVVEIQGFLNSNPDEERSKGFKEVIENEKNINIERTVVAEWQKDVAQDKIENIIKEERDIDVIFAHSDYMALGAYNALEKLGIDNVKIIGVDGLPGYNGGIELVNRGILYGTFTCPTGGKEAIDYAIKILNKEEVPKKVILKWNIITKE